MLMAVNEPYALMVQPDDILISPREVDEHFGTMVCFHPRYALGVRLPGSFYPDPGHDQ